MHIVHELDARIAESRSLLALELDHLQQVRARGLDGSWAQHTIDRRCRYIESLELHYDRVLKHRLALHQPVSIPPITEAGISDEPLSA
ncbi:MAG: hypothetical protein ABI870_02710 [Rhodanobacter sp.]